MSKKVILSFVTSVLIKINKATFQLQKTKNLLSSRVVIQIGKNAIARFQEHQKSNCHILACEHQVGVIVSSGNIIEICSTCFFKIIESVRFLARQGLAMQGHTDAESNFNQLLKLTANDVPLLTDWLQRKNDKYTSHDIQNELVSTMADIVSKQVVTSLDNPFFFNPL